MAQAILERHIRPEIVEALSDTRIVFVMGARQVGKSTLASSIVDSEHPAIALSLDSKATREAALADPTGFVADLTGPVMIDEVQRAPDLLLEIKDSVDKDPRPGRFLLTGSANILTAPKIAEALTGRVEILRLWPFSQGELDGKREDFMERLFADDPPRIIGTTKGRDAFASRVVAGGYPEARTRSSDRRRSKWFEDYLDTTLTRDLRDISDAKKLAVMPKLLQLVAARVGNLLHYDNIAGEVSLNSETIESYIGLLETIFLVKRLPAWRRGLTKRVVHAPKAYVVDSGLLCHLLNANTQRVKNDERVTGMVLENFVAMEIIKQLDWHDDRVVPHHYRDRDGYEVDLVLENSAGHVAGIEVKAAASVGKRDFRGLRKLQTLAKGDFRSGVVLYAGESTLSFGDRLWAVPISGLWA